MSCDSRGHVRDLVVGIVERLPLEHHAQHVEQAITDPAQGPSMTVPVVAQLDVTLLAHRIALNGDTGPMVHGVFQTPVAGPAADHEALLAAAPGDRSLTCHRPQSVIISLPQRLASLGEQRGENDPADSWLGAKDRYVALLAALPRRALRRGGFQLGTQLIDLPFRLFGLLIDQAQARRSGANVGAGGVRHPGATESGD